MSEKTTQQETADRQAPANELLEALGTTISPDLLVQALTHRSFSHEHPGVSNSNVSSSWEMPCWSWSPPKRCSPFTRT